MADAGHDAVFVEDAAQLRPRLERCARVLYPGIDGDVAPADRAVDQALAATYVLALDADRTLAAFRALLHPRWRPSRPHRGGADDRIALLDVAPAETGDLADDLAALGPTSQAVVVLALVGGLSADEIGRIIGAPRARVEELAVDAVDRLARLDRGRRNRDELARQLNRLAGPIDPVVSAQAGVGDLARGRAQEQRGRRRRLALVGVAATVVALVAGFALQGAGSGEVANVSAPTPIPSSSSPDPWRAYRCDPAGSDCRTLRTARWRSRMAEVIVTYLDPKRSYFSDMSYELRSQPDAAAFWSGRDGALDLTVSGGSEGATEVRVQIATNRSVADRCGKRTGQLCESLTFMNGGRFLIAGTSTSEGPVELQYAADANTVITIVARNVGSGRKLEIDTGELVRMVSDTRMQLPRR